MKETITVTKRRSGITTGTILSKLGEAILNPGQTIMFSDHANKRPAHCKAMVGMIDNVIETLGLQDIYVTVDSFNGMVGITSRFTPTYVTEDGRWLKEV